MLVIIANIVALMASILMAYSGTLKKKKKMLFVQCIEKVLLVISNILLNGISGAIVNSISFIRNFLCYKNKLNLVAKIILTVIVIPITIYFNNCGLIGLLPLFAGVTFIWFMTVKDVKKYKLLIIITTAMWSVYNLYIQAYSTFAFEILTIITNTISIIIINKKKVKK